VKAWSAAAQGALAVVGLVAAYLTWQRPAEEKDAEAVVLDVSRPALERIRYEDKKRVVEVVPGKDGTWVLQTERPAEPVAEGAPAPRTREYKANETADRVVDRFTPLKAIRSLGVLPPEKLEELGLAKAERALEVTARGTTTRFVLASDGAGAGAPYARRESDGRVFLLRGTLLSDLEFAASRLVDRRLHTFRQDEFDAVRVSGGGAERRLTRVGDKLAGASGAVDDFASNWHERLWGQTGVDVLGRGEEPAAGAPVVELRVDYLRGERQVGFIELGRAGSDVFARTEHTAGWVRLHAGADPLLKERAQVLAAG
jgi:hypothetical protein